MVPPHEAGDDVDAQLALIEQPLGGLASPGDPASLTSGMLGAAANRLLAITANALIGPAKRKIPAFGPEHRRSQCSIFLFKDHTSIHNRIAV